MSGIQGGSQTSHMYRNRPQAKSEKNTGREGLLRWGLVLEMITGRLRSRKMQQVGRVRAARLALKAQILAPRLAPPKSWPHFPQVSKHNSAVELETGKRASRLKRNPSSPAQGVCAWKGSWGRSEREKKEKHPPQNHKSSLLLRRPQDSFVTS